MEEAISRLPPLIMLAAYVVFWGWEALVTARPDRRDGRRAARNLALTLVGIVAGAASGAGILALSVLAIDHRWGLLPVMELPAWAAVVAGVLLLDLTEYMRHRVSHAVPVLWRLHRVHHTDPRIDVTTTFRSHPLEMMFRPLCLAVAVLVFGIPLLSLLLMPLLQLPVLVFEHANIRLPPTVDRILAWFIVTPGMHLVHHSRTEFETNSNYATMLALWDRLFGSFRPTVAPAAVGLDGFDGQCHQTVVGMLVNPWRRPDTAA